MISKGNMQHIHNAIQSFNQLVGRTYLICFNGSTSQELRMIEIVITEKNFWHLSGCRIDDSLSLNASQKKQLYRDCLSYKDISKYLNYTDEPKDVKIKCTVLQNIFNFITNAKVLSIIDTVHTPEQYMFSLGVGTNQGLIGYIQNKHLYFPKTAQDKSVFIKKAVKNKIRVILSKPSTSLEYGKLEYEAGNGLFAKLSVQLYGSYRLSPDLIELIPNDSFDINKIKKAILYIIRLSKTAAKKNLISFELSGLENEIFYIVIHPKRTGSDT